MAQVGSIEEKTRDRKYRWTVPINIFAVSILNFRVNEIVKQKLVLELEKEFIKML